MRVTTMEGNRGEASIRKRCNETKNQKLGITDNLLPVLGSSCSGFVSVFLLIFYSLLHEFSFHQASNTFFSSHHFSFPLINSSNWMVVSTSAWWVSCLPQRKGCDSSTCRTLATELSIKPAPNVGSRVWLTALRRGPTCLGKKKKSRFKVLRFPKTRARVRVCVCVCVWVCASFSGTSQPARNRKCLVFSSVCVRTSHEFSACLQADALVALTPVAALVTGNWQRASSAGVTAAAELTIKNVVMDSEWMSEWMLSLL